MLIVGNGRVITRETPNRLIENGAVVVDGQLIHEVGDNVELRRKYGSANYIDAQGGIIMPGLINAHSHIYSAFARGLSVKGYAPKNFKQILEGLWWTLDRNLYIEDTYLSAMATFIECIKNGCTTVFDHHASYGDISGSLFTIAEAAKRTGMRVSLCFEVSDRDGKDKAQEAINENAGFIKYTLANKNDMLKAMMGLHASFTLSDSTLEKCRNAAPQGTGFHIHVAEGPEDEEECISKHGMRVVERLGEFDMLGSKSITGHCIHIDETEMEMLKQTETAVIHNPQSNMGNAVGIPPCMKMIRRGVLLGLGTDGYTSDMFESQKVAGVIHKHVLRDPGAAWGEVPQMLFSNNAKIASQAFEIQTGVLREGAAADIIIADYIPLTPMTADNCDSHIFFGISGRSVTTTIINGEVKMKDRELSGIDEEEVLAKCRENAALLWRRINSR